MFPQKGPIEIWQALAPKQRFLSIGVEDLLEAITVSAAAESNWTDYLKARYGWPDSEAQCSM